MQLRQAILFLFSTWLLSALPLAAQPLPSIEKKTEGLTKLDGYIPLYWDSRDGSLWLEISRFDTDFLYVTGLAAGLGSNDIGLDRGRQGDTAVVSFQRSGNKIFLVQSNENFRSTSANVAERRSVEDSFARSVLAGFTVAAETDGRVLVNATDAFVRDGFGLEGALHPGKYAVDKTRSALYLPRTKTFPKNTEIEVTLTFSRDAEQFEPGNPVQGPPRIGQGGGRASARTMACSQDPLPASLPMPAPSRCASTTRWSSCRTIISSLAASTRAPATSAIFSSITACPSASP